jgi:hypothetical protein
MDTFATGQTNRFPGELPFGIHDHVIGARILRDSHLVLIGHALDFFYLERGTPACRKVSALQESATNYGDIRSGVTPSN